MARRHAREFFYISNCHEMRGRENRPASTAERQGAFRFSEMVKRGTPDTDMALLRVLAERMVAAGNTQTDSHIPAGFTYLGQFIDHDLTLDPTKLGFADNVSVAEIEGGRSPALDLDSVYGRGPGDARDRVFYEPNGVKFRLGRAVRAPLPPTLPPIPGNTDRDGFDLPRKGAMASEGETREALIADRRNDENLAVAQTHLAFLRFHNAMVDRLSAEGTPSALLFDRARSEATLHYQWMIRHDFLPRLVDKAVLEDVFAHGRRVFEPDGSGPATMPIEFSVAAYRLGHSMIRDEYDWNEVFNDRPGALDRGTLTNLFNFSGTSGHLNPSADPDTPPSGPAADNLVTIWVADWTRLFNFPGDGRPAELAPHAGGVVNMAHPLDPAIANLLRLLPRGSFGGRGLPEADPMERNLAFRNLVRGRMLRLATAQEVARHFQALGAATPILTADKILRSASSGVDLNDLSTAMKDELVTATPLWFYILREAEHAKTGRLGPVGGRIVAETFHRAMEASRTSLLRQPYWRPMPGGTHKGGFGMVDLLCTAYDPTKGELRPVSPGAPIPSRQREPAE